MPARKSMQRALTTTVGAPPAGLGTFSRWIPFKLSPGQRKKRQQELRRLTRTHKKISNKTRTELLEVDGKPTVERDAESNILTFFCPKCRVRKPLKDIYTKNGGKDPYGRCKQCEKRLKAK